MKLKDIYIFDDFMRLPFFFYHTIGIEPYVRTGVTSHLTRFQQFNFVFGIVNLNIMLIAEVIFVLSSYRNGENFIEATMTISYIGFVIIGEFKMITIWLKKSLITQFVQDMEQLFPNEKPKQIVYKVEYHLKRCLLITKTFSGIYMLLIWSYNVMSILQYLITKWILHNPNAEQTFPFVNIMPWLWKGNILYYIIYMLQVYAGHTSATGHISSDLLLHSVLTQMIMHFEYIGYDLQTYEIKSKVNNRVCERGIQDDIHFLQNIIAYHVKLLRLSDVMNDIFGVPLLLNFIISSLNVCLIGFVMTIGVEPEVYFKLWLFLISSTGHNYLICHYSQQLIDASFGIATAVYNQEWSNADVRFKKMLILIMARAQSPCYLKATVFMSISRGTMTEIMQMSYKFFTLLRTMYSK